LVRKTPLLIKAGFLLLGDFFADSTCWDIAVAAYRAILMRSQSVASTREWLSSCKSSAVHDWIDVAA
jgi:hypothetical protein